MTFHSSKLHRLILTLAVLMMALGGTALAQEPVDPAPAGATIELVGPSEVALGDQFEIQVVASNIPDPGIFGFQLTFNWDETVFSPVEYTVNGDFPVEAQSVLGTNTIEVAASRQGNVADVTGPVTLMTVTVQADALTDPNVSTFSVTEEKLGRKGGIEVAVDEVINLDVLVSQDGGGGDNGDIIGSVLVEGRAADNQAGHTVAIEGGSSTTTDATGDFTLLDVEFGTYTLVASRAGFLSATCADVDHTSDPTSLASVELLAGDVVGDDVIDIADATAIGVAFNGTDATADLNADGIVDILDLILMAANFGETSVDNPWTCVQSQ